MVRYQEHTAVNASAGNAHPRAPQGYQGQSPWLVSAGGVADHFVTQMLRQGDSGVFKRYSQAKLNMMREALAKLDRRANEREANSGTGNGKPANFGTVLTQ